MPKSELSAAEWEIMNVIWRAGGLVNVREVLTTAYPQGEKAYTTVQTLMNILVDKGYLDCNRGERKNRYRPLVARDVAVNGSLHGLAQRLFHGSVGAMASFLVGSAKLRPDELAGLRSLLDSREE